MPVRKRSRRVRRLFDIDVDRVSVVSRAANDHEFLVMKRKSEENMDDEQLKKVLKSVEDALNTLSSDTTKELKAVKEGIEALKEVDNTDEAVIKKFDDLISSVPVEKAGAKFSAKTLNSLKSAYKTLQSLLNSAGVLESEKEEGTEKGNEGKDDDALLKGLRDGFGVKEESSEEDEEKVKEVAAVVSEVFKQLEKKKGDGNTGSDDED